MSDHRSFALPGARPQYGPDKVVDVLHIDLRLRPDLEAKRLDAVCTTTVRAIEDGVALLALDAVDLEVVSVVRTDDGRALAYRSTSETLEITIDPPLRAGDELEFGVEYAVRNPRRGMYFIEHEPKHVWTQSQDSDARFWFPCLDYPAEKQTTSATVIVPKGHFALANGALVERTEGRAETVFRYEQHIPHSTYLVTMVAGPFSEIKQPHDRVPLWYYTLPGREEDGERAFGNTPRMIDVFERTIGVPYPYERYSQIAVADFTFGGMENTSATTQTDRVLHDERAHLDYSADYLASHELAHQWFGDLVTCRDWAHAWLNEGFATYCEAVWLEADKGWDEYLYDVYGVVQRYLEEDAERYRRPIVCNLFRDPIELFDRHLYEKGAAVLHMLRGQLGWDRMKRSLTRYVRSNAQRNVETIDLIRAIEAETGRNTRRFFAQWVERGGHPQLDVSYRWDADRKTALITVAQKQVDRRRQPGLRVRPGRRLRRERPRRGSAAISAKVAAARRDAGAVHRRRVSRARSPSRSTASRRWCASIPRRGCSRRGRRRSVPTCTPRSSAAIRRRSRASARRKRSRRTATAWRAKRSRRRWRRIASGASAWKSLRRSAEHARRPRATCCSRTPVTRTPRCGARSPTRSATGATSRSRTRCSPCATIRRTS